MELEYKTCLHCKQVLYSNSHGQLIELVGHVISKLGFLHEVPPLRTPRPPANPLQLHLGPVLGKLKKTKAARNVF